MLFYLCKDNGFLVLLYYLILTSLYITVVVHLKFGHTITFLLFFSSFSLAQFNSNLHSKIFQTNSDTLFIDSLSIIPSSVVMLSLQGDIINKTDYTFDYLKASLFLNSTFPYDSFEIIYRTYPYAFHQAIFSYSMKNFLEENQDLRFLLNTNNNQKSTNANFLDFGSLVYQGDFLRGFSFGNAQSLNVNSSFNLQIAGMLSKDIALQAAITDNTIPIQPEGNTANIQDFDNVYIQLAYQKHYLKLGDFDLKSPNSYFMRFQKSLQGLSYKGEQKLNNDYTANAMASVSITRGLYALNTLETEDGNQGPYKLKGTNNETYIVILSGSERVFLDGLQLERGITKDYIIDYNLGEIRFTSKVLITQYMRIKVEFEYSDNSYFRYMYHLNVGIEHNKWSWDVQFYAEQDNKRQSLNQDLDDAKIDFLNQIGDSINQAYYQSAQNISFDRNRVLYTKKDTIINGVLMSFYEYSIDSTKSVYALNFTFVGVGNGNYEPTASVANGRVFTWIAPDENAQKKGSYEPVVVLVTPKLRQLFTSQWMYKPIKNTKIGATFSLSNLDLNTFSTKDNQDNLGYATHFLVEDVRYLSKDSLSILQTTSAYEYKQKRFSPLERYRDIEFQRNWNTNQSQVNDEHLAFVLTKWNSKYTNLAYRFSFYNQLKNYTGVENSLVFALNKKDYLTHIDLKWLKSTAIEQKANFIRPKIEFAKTFQKLKKLTLGTILFNEYNAQKDLKTDTLLNNSFYWQDYSAYISVADSSFWNLKLSYNYRQEHLSSGFTFKHSYLNASKINFEGYFKHIENHFLTWNVSYRNLQIDTSQRKNIQELKHFYLVNLNYQFKYLKGFLMGNVNYELSTGREQKMQYNYVQAPDGQGAYAWKDFNLNGVQELNEFYISNFLNENIYLRLVSNTLSFIPVQTTAFQYNLQINPRAIFKNKTGFQSILSKISNSTQLSLTKKMYLQQASPFFTILSPVFLEEINDSLLVSLNQNIKNTLSYNKNDSKYSFDYNFLYFKNTNLLTSGLEKRLLTSHEFKARWNVNALTSFSASYLNGIKQNSSDFYFANQYEYLFNEADFILGFLFKKTLRLNLSYHYAFRSNPLLINGGQHAVINEAGMETKYSRPGNFSILVQFKYSTVGYNDNGKINEQLSIDMLQNLSEGNNYIWSINFDKTIAKNFQFSLMYDGRKLGNNTTVHTGRAQVRALF